MVLEVRRLVRRILARACRIGLVALLGIEKMNQVHPAMRQRLADNIVELIVEHSRGEPVSGFAHEIFKAARRIAFTLRRLRKIDDIQPVAYLGQDRMLDLRMVCPRQTDDGDGSDNAERSLDSGG